VGPLGIVTYTWGNDHSATREYLRVVGRVGAYPGFSSEPIESFQHLADDLAGVASPILDLTRDQFHGIAQRVRDLPKPGPP
jgi:hypothetical protein